MTDNCLFCKIAAGQIPSEIVYQDEDGVAFRDINPQAPTHVLVIPREHLGNAAAASAEDAGLMGRLLLIAAQVARQEGIEESGYRLVLNVGPHGGESVPHLHIHLIGGRQLAWPPG